MLDVGIAGIATYIPAGRITSAEIAKRSGIPEAVIREKFGIHQKTKANDREMPSTMALAAARSCLKSAGIAGAELDAVIYFGSEYKDHYVWALSTWLIEQIGARRAFGFDMYATCTGLIVALQMARDMQRGNPALNNVLLVGASRESDLLDYTDPLSRFIFNFADGAGAVLLRRDYARNRILDIDFKFDGRFSRCVQVPTIGTEAFGKVEQFSSAGKPAFRVSQPEKMKAELDPVSVTNFAEVITNVVRKSGYTPADLALIALLHAKRSYTLSVLRECGISEDKILYAWDYGHIQTLDTILALQRAVSCGKVSDGDFVVLASAGAGYSWGAAAIAWG